MSNATARFEALGSLYYRATGYLRPGKDEPVASGRDSSSPENRERFEQWLATSALTAALDQIVELEAEVERLKRENEYYENLADELNQRIGNMA